MLPSDKSYALPIELPLRTHNSGRKQVRQLMLCESLASFVAMHCVVGVTARSKSHSQDGALFVLVDVVVEHSGVAEGFAALRGGALSSSAATGAAVRHETISLELTLPQFYQVLTALEEASANLASLAEDI